MKRPIVLPDASMDQLGRGRAADRQWAAPLGPTRPAAGLIAKSEEFEG